jgi:hypothetical protein
MLGIVSACDDGRSLPGASPLLCPPNRGSAQSGRDAYEHLAAGARTSWDVFGDLAVLTDMSTDIFGHLPAGRAPSRHLVTDFEGHLGTSWPSAHECVECMSAYDGCEERSGASGGGAA